MTGKEFYREIGLIDEDLLEEAKERKGKGRYKYLFLEPIVAACVVIAIIGSVWWNGMKTDPEQPPIKEKPDTEREAFSYPAEGEAPKQTVGETYTLEFAEVTDGPMMMDWAIPGHFWEELTEEEMTHICDGLRTFDACIEPKLNANYNGDGDLVNVDGYIEMWTGGELYFQAAPGEVTLGCIYWTENEVISDILGIPVSAGYYESSVDDHTTYYANFAIEDVGYYVELVGGEPEKEVMPSLIAALIRSGKADFSVLHPTVPQWREDELTEAEAYQDEEFGSYLPKRVPSEFGFEGATRIFYEATATRKETNCLIGMWWHGHDQIWWNISYLAEEDKALMTSTTDTVNYDLSLYPIPRADSVPEELREIVDHPIFKMEELTEEVVARRAYRIDEIGDTDGYRMDFSVLYPENVLVKLNIKGVDPQVVYQMLEEISENLKNEIAKETPE